MSTQFGHISFSGIQEIPPNLIHPSYIVLFETTQELNFLSTQSNHK